MKHFRSVLVLCAALSISLIIGCGDQSTEFSGPVSPQETVTLSKENPKVKAAVIVQEKHADHLMKNKDIVGTAVGMTDDGNPALIVYTKHKLGHPAIPQVLENLPVIEEVSEEIIAYQFLPAGKGGNKGGSKGGAKIDPTDRFQRPVPIGVSVGNIEECSAGTIGCRVKGTGLNSEKVYVLSNNHVLARENSASSGELIVQPGKYDNSCVREPADQIATEISFVPIVFTTSANNTVDAAIARSSSALLDNSTPSNGYGTPNRNTLTATVGMPIQKYGRTTGMTNAKVTGINAIFNVRYSSGTARFINQIVISSKKPFSRPGDSGSLIVTNDNNANPVGLLFAGSNTVTLANPISEVLNSLQISVDGK